MKRYSPRTASRRNMVTLPYNELLTTSTPHKALTVGKHRSVGRNNTGRITTRHKGGGNKRSYRLVDFKYDKKNIPAKVVSIEYDPNRTAFISLVQYDDGEKRYIIAPRTIKVGDTFVVAEKTEVKIASRMTLKNIPVGTNIYNLEIKPQGGGKLVRSAGNYAQIVAHDAGYALVKMPSSEIRKIIDTSWASIGEVSNEESHLQNFGKAGKSRWKGIRPTVRGTAMNPVDHPHGGGEGRQGRGRRRAISIYGKPTGKGQKSRTPKKYSNRLIVTRRKKK
ncbi:MAG: 50S ribosomal protein L2 [Patescibacteria group bacterium]